MSSDRIAGEPRLVSRMRSDASRDWLVVLALCSAAFVLAAAVAWAAFEGMPHLEDEHANLFQAKAFAAWRFTNPAPPVPDAFFVPFVVVRDGHQFSKYPPGYPLLLATGVLLGQPWVVNALAAAAGILATYLLGRDLLGSKTGLLAAALGVASPMYVMLSGTLLSHSTTLALLTLFSWAFLRARLSTEPRRYSYAWAAGGLGGLAFATRPWTAFGIGLPFAALALFDLVQKRDGARNIYCRMGATFALAASLWPLYNWINTGSVLTNTYTLVWNYDRLGFGPQVGPFGYAWSEAMINLRLGLDGLASFATGWPAWRQLRLSLLQIFIVLGVALPKRTMTEPLLLVPVFTLVTVYTGYWAVSIGLLGPRYYVEAMPFLWLVVARGLQKSGRQRFGRVLLAILIPSCLVWNITWYSLPRLQQQKAIYGISREDANRMGAAGIHNGLIFVESDRWMEYASLSWLNEADLATSDNVFAEDLGAEINRLVANSFPGRQIWCYDRRLSVPLGPCTTGR